MTDEQWVASRKLALNGEECVEIRIGVPVRVGEAFRCAVQITGLERHSMSTAAYGADSIQAVTLALQMAGDTLYASDEAACGVLRWGVLRNLGFPVSEAILDRVPKDEG